MLMQYFTQHLARAFNFILIVVLLGMIFTASGCSKTGDDGMTVGQKKVDRTIDQTNTAAAQSGQDIQNAARETDHKLAQGANHAADELRKDTASAQDKSGDVGTVVDDSAITASVKADMLKDPDLSVLKVDVSTDRGEVTLKGRVDTEAAKQHASELAQAVDGVQKVDNQLQVAADAKKDHNA